MTGKSSKTFYWLALLVLANSCQIPAPHLVNNEDVKNIPTSASKASSTNYLPTIDNAGNNYSSTDERVPTSTLNMGLRVDLSATPTHGMDTPSYSVYHAQSGDSLAVIARRFGISVQQISSPEVLPNQGILSPGQVLYLSWEFTVQAPSNWLLPDSEIIYGPSAASFSVSEYLSHTNGFLKSHREYLKSTGWTSAADILTRIALENSINPRILLSLLEYKCHCVLGQLDKAVPIEYLLGNTDFRRSGLYLQLGWAASQLSVGYYGWRSGWLDEFTFSDGTNLKASPDLNPGSAALQYFFAFYRDRKTWEQAVDEKMGLASLHTRMFGDPWEREDEYGPIFPRGIQQPSLILPFEQKKVWSFTSGPHPVWEKVGALAALDFAPATYYPGCIPSDAWVVAMASGVVSRAEYAAVILDLDNPDGTPADGQEQTGWVILYMHIESRDRISVGTHVLSGDPIGHPSCEGGRTTGTHVHIARKFNGEWILADSALPFIMDGWRVYAGNKSYEGYLVKQNNVVVAHPYGSFITTISRPTPTPPSIQPYNQN